MAFKIQNFKYISFIFFVYHFEFILATGKYPYLYPYKDTDQFRFFFF